MKPQPMLFTIPQAEVKRESVPRINPHSVTLFTRVSITMPWEGCVDPQLNPYKVIPEFRVGEGDYANTLPTFPGDSSCKGC